MASSLSNLVNNLSEGIHRIKWQVHFQILLIIFLKEFIELDVNSDRMIKNMKHVEFNISIVTIYNINDD